MCREQKIQFAVWIHFVTVLAVSFSSCYNWHVIKSLTSLTSDTSLYDILCSRQAEGCRKLCAAYVYQTNQLSLESSLQTPPGVSWENKAE